MKKAFTLIELVIAIAIFSIIVVYMTKAASTTSKSSAAYERVYQRVNKTQKVKKLLYNDIFNQVDITSTPTISNEDKTYNDTTYKTSRYCIRTNNSLHDLVQPYICYMVKNGTLYRLESLTTIKFPLKEKSIKTMKIDAIMKNTNQFYIMSSKNNNLIQLNVEDINSTFEISLPYGKKVVVVSS